ncbi:MAG TPA: glutamate synthase [Ruminococcaceae bacterium]|jgi:glutamate synthase domain-containing protein 3|nr:glutamate synthase [Oscillospiraceae bacterium]HBQ45800.1 glutamate synthase [Oscillospiraceae bacterium]HCB91797.1 glutamate synthase [Oscillospiraceae bacterium]
MFRIDADGKYFQQLNEEIRVAQDSEILVEHCMGQRYIGAGVSGKHLLIRGVPGNDLGCYLDGGTIRVQGNAQDQTGDTMNAGAIVVEGSSGDATGYSMRGGKIFIRGNAGYRVGIHMKAYREHQPLIVVGGETGSFLGEYQAGGTIIVLGLDSGGKIPVGNLSCTGMHGGRMYLRCRELPKDLPAQVKAARASAQDMARIDGFLDDFCRTFGIRKETVLSEPFFVVMPNTSNPYRSLYTFN